MRSFPFVIVVVAALTGCKYDESCRDVVVPAAHDTRLSIARCGLRQCVKVQRTSEHRLSFRLPDQAGTFRLEDLRAEECVGGSECTRVTGTILVREVDPPAEGTANGKLDADALIDAPSTFQGKTTWHYAERWDEWCRDVEWPETSRIF